MANEEITSREKLEFYKWDLKTLLIYCTIGWTIAVIGFIVLLVDNSLLFILPVTMIPGGIICIIPVFKKLNNGASLKGVWVDVETVTTYKDGHKTREADFGGSLGMTLLHLIPVILKALLCVFMLPFLILHRGYMVFKLSKELGETSGSYKYLGFTAGAMVYFIVGLVLWGNGALSGLGTGRTVRDDFKDRPEEKVEIINTVQEFMYTHNHKAYTSYYYVEYNRTTKSYNFKVKEGEEANFDQSYSKVLEAGHVYTVNVDTKQMNVDGQVLSSRYNGTTLTEVEKDLVNLCPLLCIPFNEMVANYDKVAIKDNSGMYEIKYTSDDTEVIFATNDGLLFVKPKYSISSYSVKGSILGYSIVYTDDPSVFN